MSEASGWRRLIVSLAFLVPTTRPAWSAIPSFSEYDAVQYKKKAATEPLVSELPPSVADGLVAVQSELKRAAALVEEGRLEDVRVLLRRPLFATFLGYTPGLRGNAGAIVW